jgi:transaldolase
MYHNVDLTYNTLAGFGRSDGLVLEKTSDGYVQRLKDYPISYSFYRDMKPLIRAIGVTGNFKEVIDTFKTEQGKLPAGFIAKAKLQYDGLLEVDLIRNINYEANGKLRPTKMLFSADSANPYEVETVKNMVANLTCNPAIIYDRFINNREANIGGKFKDRKDVLLEIGNILGPGCDISVELKDPFGSSVTEILEECAQFRDMLTKYRVVIKVPHTGMINAQTVNQLTSGEQHMNRRYNNGSTADFFRGHNIALLLREHGYRVNFTLMFEPYQTALALQAKPYFINSFIQMRYGNSLVITGLLKSYEETGDTSFIEKLKIYMYENDYIGVDDFREGDTFEIFNYAKEIIRYRGMIDNSRGDGLDAVRHNLRILKSANLDDTRLILCNFQNEYLYYYLDRLMAEEEFADMTDKIVITSPPEFIARFTSSPLVNFYHRRFINAMGKNC